MPNSSRKAEGKGRSISLTPVQALLLGFIAIILVGAFLLTLPISSTNHTWQSFLDTSFIATSAISTSGLSPVDIGSYYNVFGQIVVFLLFQIGGLGFMVFISFVIFVVGTRPAYKDGFTIQESIAGMSWQNMKDLSKKVIFFTAFFEIAGGLIFGFESLDRFTPLRSFYYGFFHSVSGFCTAGFGLLPDNFVSYQKNIGINIVEDILAIAGGIGFFVLNDVYYSLKKISGYLNPRRLSFRTRFEKMLHHIRPWRFSLHTKMVVLMSIVLMFLGTVIIFVSENWRSDVTIGDRLMISSFQSISASTTTGYNTTDIGKMSDTSLFTMVILMFIGASPGSTGGGIKTTTFGVIVILLFSVLLRRNDSNFFFERIPQDAVNKACAIGLLSILIVMVDVIILTFTEKAPFMNILFETVSAFGNTGLSMGLTSSLSDVGKFVLTITMLVGRVGPLSVGLSILGKAKRHGYRYVEGDIYVG